MLSHCLKWRIYAEYKSPKVVKTKNWRTMVLSNCDVCSNKKSRCFKEPEAKMLLGSGLSTIIDPLLI